MDDDWDRQDQERLTERLITALAAQVAGNGTLADPEAWAELTRGEVRWFFRSAGHLAHYDGDPDGRIAGLAAIILDQLTAAADPAASIRPGDRVRRADPQRSYTVVHAAPDGTVDIQPTWLDDYAIETVPIDSVTRED